MSRARGSFLVCAVVTSAAALAIVPPLTVHINASPAEVIVDEAVPIVVTVHNSSSEAQVLQTATCAYGEWSWSTDNAAVVVHAPPVPACKKNPVAYMKLGIGESFEKKIVVDIRIAATERIPETETFRVGFAPQLGYNGGDDSVQWIWSNPVIVHVRPQ